MRVHHQAAVVDNIAVVRTLLPLEAVAAVHDLLVTDVQLGRGQPPDDVTAVQVAIMEEEAGLLGRVVGEVAAALRHLAELLADGVDVGPVGDVGEVVQELVGVGVAAPGGEVRTFGGQIPVAVTVDSYVMVAVVSAVDAAVVTWPHGCHREGGQEKG